MNYSQIKRKNTEISITFEKVVIIVILLFSTLVSKGNNSDSLTIIQSYHQFINAENKHDAATVKAMLYNSPGTLLVAKTKTKEEGGWAGFWGKEIVGQHLEALISGDIFEITPDYEAEKITFIKADVAELYVPVKIKVSYAGQVPAARPFLMIIIWVRDKDGWKIQSDLAIPVPQS
jgi:hypothetical protein